MSSKPPYTFLIPGSGDGAPPRVVRLGSGALWLLVFFLFLSLGLGAVGAYGLGVSQREAEGLNKLHLENQAYLARIEHYETLTKELRAELDGLKAAEVRLKRRYGQTTEPVSPHQGGEGQGASSKGGVPSIGELGAAVETGPGIPSIMPVDGGWVSSAYGRRISPFTGAPHLHAGIDLVVPVGTPVRVTADGKIRAIRRDNANGLYIDVEHSDTIRTRYAHLDSWDVERGQRVKQGDVIASSGMSGNATGPHLHYEVRVDGEAVDPAPYLPGGLQGIRSQGARADDIPEDSPEAP